MMCPECLEETDELTDVGVCDECYYDHECEEAMMIERYREALEHAIWEQGVGEEGDVS